MISNLCCDSRESAYAYLPGRVGGTDITSFGLWVPVTLSPHATCEYSRIRPPSQSQRRTLHGSKTRPLDVDLGLLRNRLVAFPAMRNPRPVRQEYPERLTGTVAHS